MKNKTCRVLVSPLCQRWVYSHPNISEYVRSLVDKDMLIGKRPVNLAENKVGIGINLTAGQMEWAKAHGNVSGYIAQLIEDDMLGKNL